MSDDLDKIYASYRAWKGSYRIINRPAEEELFIREFARLNLATGSRIFEIGFGEGLFLDWAREQGFNVQGVEIIKDYVDAAGKRGHNVRHGTAKTVLGSLDDQFEAVVCFDVLEHLTPQEIIELLTLIGPLLKPDGVILARFPNGGSPFGRYYQHGDATHLTALTGLQVDQLAFMAGLKVAGTYNAARVITNARYFGIVARAKQVLALSLEWLIGKLFFGFRLPLDPNIVVHIRHSNRSAPK